MLTLPDKEGLDFWQILTSADQGGGSRPLIFGRHNLLQAPKKVQPVIYVGKASQDKFMR